MKQKVTVTSKSASASIWRSNQSVALGRKLSAQLSPVRSFFVPSRFIQATASSSRGSSKWNHCISPISPATLA